MDCEQRLEAIGLPAAIRHVSPLSQGHNATLHSVTLTDGSIWVAKQGPEKAIETEAFMLDYLAKHSALPVPKLLFAGQGLLVMEQLVDDGRLNESAQQQAAELLAALHGVRGDAFGLPRDTTIGPLHQPNAPNDSWVSFFAKQRLLYMGEEAVREGALATGTMHRLERLAARLGEWIDEPAHPSLIHGDMWQGNVLAANGCVSGFIDPAIYYADPEIELAFSTLFGTFGDAFFHRYDELRPIADGFFDCRRDLYNLYPLLVHVRIYGGGYARSVEATLKRMVG